MESILTLDRLRQSVAIKELEQSHGQSLSMRKTVSVPNFSQVWRLLRVYTTLIFFVFFILKRYQASGFHFLITNPVVLCVYCVLHVQNANHRIFNVTNSNYTHFRALTNK